MYSRAGQVMSSMTSLWSRTYQKVLTTDSATAIDKKEDKTSTVIR